MGKDRADARRARGVHEIAREPGPTKRRIAGSHFHSPSGVAFSDSMPSLTTRMSSCAGKSRLSG